MTLLNEQQLDNIAQAIQAVETETDAELITVLAQRADSYYYIPTLWAAVIALLIPFPLKFTPLWLDGNDLLLAQWLTFIVLAIVFRIPRAMMLLVPKSVKHWRATKLARSQFLENNLHHTINATGVLIFVSEAERYAEIIADRGIDRHVPQEQWQSIISELTSSIKAGKTEQGFLRCIEQCGTLLKQYAPATHKKNELPNHVVVL